jgi:hypothetical protein
MRESGEVKGAAKEPPDDRRSDAETPRSTVKRLPRRLAVIMGRHPLRESNCSDVGNKQL